MRSTFFLAALLCTALTVRSDAVSDAQKLKEEAVTILKANANQQATPEQYATCIYKLEQAQALLEKAGQNDSALAQEVSSTLFWSRRFSDVHVIKALDKVRAGGASTATAPATPAVPKKAEPAKTAVTPPKEKDEDEPRDVFGEAKKAFQEAEQYAAQKTGDDYAIALRWFQVANEYAGTDFGLKAIELARAAQARFNVANVKPEELPDTPENKLILDADKLAEAGQYEKAFPMYMASIKIKDTILAHRRLGHAYFKRAQQIKDEFMPEFDQANNEWRSARNDAWTVRRTMGGSRRVFNPNYPPLIEAQRKLNELLKKANVSLDYYRKAESEFRTVLKLNSAKDLDAQAHIAMSLSVQGDPNVRSRARQEITKLLNEYKPKNDAERTLYEFCKTELDRINRGK